MKQKIYKVIGIFICIMVVLTLLALTLHKYSNSRTKQFAGEIIDSVDTEQKVVALTFDDGPSQNTEEILLMLDELDIKATGVCPGGGGGLRQNTQVTILSTRSDDATMRWGSTYSLQRTMIVYFLLISFASLLVGVEFIVDVHKSEFRQALQDNFEGYQRGDVSAEAVFAPVDRLRDKAILMVAIILAVVIIVLTMFIKNITEPLQHMIEKSKEISKGDLSHTLTIHARNELAELSGVINEMSSNLQEIILLTKNLCLAGEKYSETAGRVLSQNSLSYSDVTLLRRELEALQSEMGVLREFVDYFHFYTFERPRGE